MSSCSLNRVEVTSLIARGSSGAVHLGRNLDTFEPLAIKEVTLTANGRAVFRSERSLLRKLPPHRNVPQLLGHMKTKKVGYLVLPYLPFPTLQTYIETKGPIPEADAIYILAQMIETLTMMKDNGVCHRDIKGDNIIINPDTLLIKIIDFGLGLSVKDEYTPCDMFIGTPIYMSPEILMRDGPFWVVVSDVWSVGVVFLEMLLGRHPFQGAESEEHLMDLHDELDYSQFSSRARGLLDLLLSDLPGERINALDLVRNESISLNKNLTSVSPLRPNKEYHRRRSHSITRSKTMDGMPFSRRPRVSQATTPA
eukprot:TRINITY_DN213_c0_g1_i5.p1 TRINITY_DN213_c0_g1~~TRINITY_DN213_c0_g1_i5.p1  ORF type:complete len:310 (+),score=56.84 TRINITY_DN213_c0_g1_i5:192-1121(+)